MSDTLRELIGIIAAWKLPETGETWPSGEPVSYESNHGSFGVRDYIRSIANKALALLDEESKNTRAPLQNGGTAGDEVARDAARYRFLCDVCTSHYGDGYNDPREAHVSLDWGQGAWIHDGSNGGRGRADEFPGWSAIIDKMMEETEREEDRDAALSQSQPIDQAIAGKGE